MTLNIGRYFQNASSMIKPATAEIEQAKRTLQRIVDSYENIAGKDSLKKDSAGVKDETKFIAPRGLLYGRIQSGKTRAMILSSALALDNGFRVVVILTSNINRLVDQTHDDFNQGLAGIKIFDKNDLDEETLQQEAKVASLMLTRNTTDGMVVVCQKGPKVLEKVVEFLKRINAKIYPSIIFDDEGDQASLNTQINKTDPAGKPAKPSPIHALLHYGEVDSLQKYATRNVFVSVTGTPQGLVLQSSQSLSKPSFIELLEPGPGYVGGEAFFKIEDPENNPLIKFIERDEGTRFGQEENDMPDGLKDSICFFILSATAVGLSNLDWNSYKFLCHPSREQNGHDLVYKKIQNFLSETIKALDEPTIPTSSPIIKRLEDQYKELKKTLSDCPSLEKLLAEAKDKLIHMKTFIINGKTTNHMIRYSPYYNFLIGGNSVGRGLAIKQLLVTYYVREPKEAKMDTMYQHARMFGYRNVPNKSLMSYIRLFLPPQLYARFHEIYLSDEELRSLIKKDESKAIQLLIRSGLRGLKPTKSNTIPASKVEILRSGQQIHPVYAVYDTNKAKEIRTNVLGLFKVFGFDITNAEKAKKGMKINTKVALQLIKVMTDDNSDDIWNKKTVPAYLLAFAVQKENEDIMLRYRKAPERRNIYKNGSLPTGIYGGTTDARLDDGNMPVLWIFDVNGTKSHGWDGEDFLYPTIIAPKNATPFFFTRP